jgi:hypothetical protein
MRTRIRTQVKRPILVYSSVKGVVAKPDKAKV